MNKNFENNTSKKRVKPKNLKKEDGQIKSSKKKPSKKND